MGPGKTRTQTGAQADHEQGEQVGDQPGPGRGRVQIRLHQVKASQQEGSRQDEPMAKGLKMDQPRRYHQPHGEYHQETHKTAGGDGHGQPPEHQARPGAEQHEILQLSHDEQPVQPGAVAGIEREKRCIGGAQCPEVAKVEQQRQRQQHRRGS